MIEYECTVPLLKSMGYQLIILGAFILAFIMILEIMSYRTVRHSRKITRRQIRQLKRAKKEFLEARKKYERTMQAYLSKHPVPQPNDETVLFQRIEDARGDFE